MRKGLLFSIWENPTVGFGSLLAQPRGKQRRKNRADFGTGERVCRFIKEIALDQRGDQFYTCRPGEFRLLQDDLLAVVVER